MVNNDTTSTWVAGVNPVFAGKKFSEVKGMLGALLTSAPQIPTTKLRSRDPLPIEFDTYEKWQACTQTITDQGNCGSCWAMSGAQVLTDRFCTESMGKIKEPLSPQDMVSCESDEYACQGGYLSREWEYMEKTGLVTEKCFPYVSGKGYVPKCPKQKCPTEGVEWIKYKAKKGSTLHFHDAESAMVNMVEKGSIQAGFTVYQDFFAYKSGVYKHKSTSVAGGHAVKVQGYGVDSLCGEKYWNVANSWGIKWGMSGYFWILRGTNECDFESQLYTADAEINIP